MIVKVRDADVADLPRILAITNEAIANTTAIWSLTPATMATQRAWFDERAAKGFPILVATEGAADGADVAGFASFGTFRARDGYDHTVEHSIYVDAAMHGRGIGKALLAPLIDRAEALGKHVIIGGIEAGNAASIGLHARFGFEEVGRLREVGRKFDRWLDLVFMQRLLGDRARTA